MERGVGNKDRGRWSQYHLNTGVLDIALVPYWYALEDASFQRLLDVIPARTVVLLHVPVGAAPGLGDLQARYPQVRVPRQPGEVVDLAP